MSRYIDADELIRFYEPYADMKVPVNALLEQIKDTSTADVVEVVRCKDCRHNGSFDTDCPFGWRDERFNLPDDMDYCSYGERKHER